MHVATFQVTEHERTVIESLTQLGFEFGSSSAMTTTLLDTFDGRLHRAGLRLHAEGSERVELVLSGEGTAPAHLSVDAVPRVPADLPAGPFRSRIAALVDVRALTPQLRVGSHRTRGRLRDAAGKVVGVAELHQGLHVVDRPDVGCPTATIEIHRIPGYIKQTRRALTTLRDLGLPERHNDTVAECAAAAGIDLAGFTAAATVPLDPAMSAIEGFRLVLATLATAITANWQGTVDQLDPEFLHDLRIAVRRTRTILAEAQGVLPDAVLESARGEFGWLADLTGAPRDLDVYLIEWSGYTEPLGAQAFLSLEPVRDLLERRRSDGRLDLERALRSARATELTDAWQTWLAQPLGGDHVPPRAGRPLGRLVAKRIARAHDVLLQRGRLIRPDTPAEQVHDLRKDAKKLRYLLECFGSLLPTRASKRYVKRLKALQDNLGEHQDADVHASMLRPIARELHETGASSETLVAIGRLTERLDQQRLAARAEFADRFAEYDTPATRGALHAVLDGIKG